MPADSRIEQDVALAYNKCKLALLTFVTTDLQRILHEEGCNSEQEGWHFLKKTDTAEIWKKHDDDSPIKLVKVYTAFYMYMHITKHNTLQI